ncbi:Ycf1 [Orobanche gracilis]
MLKTRTRLCNDDHTKEYLLKGYDPLLNGSFRKKTYKIFLLSTLRLEKIPLENLIENFGINRIHGILLLPLNTDYQEFNIKQKISKFDKKPLSTEIIEFLTLISRLIIKWGSVDLNEYLIWKTLFLSQEGRKIKKNIKNLMTKIETDINDQKIIKKSTRIKEIRKKVLRWSYKLKEEFEDILSHLYIPKEPGEFEILSSEYKSALMWSTNKLDSTNLKDKDPNDPSKIENHYILRYGIESDFQRHYIVGSVRAQRRKVSFFKLFQTKVHSPLFLDRLKNFLYRIKRIFYLIKDDISFLIKLIFRIINRVGNKEKFKSLAYIEKQTKKTKKEAKQNEWEEIERLRIAANWEMIPNGMEIRGLLLLFQSFFRKRILFPLLIIAKNIGRILLFQPSELHEDFKEWDKEIYVNCTYEGIPLSEKDFPEDWLVGGFQIKILSPFRLKPWNKLKLESNNKEIGFSFLTVWGMETKYPFGPPRKTPPFFKPIFIELKKKINKKVF